MYAPISSSSLGKSSGLGAIDLYDRYIGVCFICSNIAELTTACCGSISG